MREEQIAEIRKTTDETGSDWNCGDDLTDIHA